MRGNRTLARLALLLRGFARGKQWSALALWFMCGLPLMAVSRLSLALDELFHRDLVDLPLEKPVFIMGHPRSGTSFFQSHVFHSGTAAMFTTWELFVPSLLLRRLLRPLVRVLSRNNADLLQSSDYGHEVRLTQVEEDEGIFLHRLDTEMMTFLCPRLLTDDDLANVGFRLGWLSRKETKRSAEFYRRCLRRNVYHSGKRRVVAKSNPSVFRLQQLLRTFPDARIVYMVRDPVDSVRSFLSFTERFVGPLLPADKRDVYFRRKYEWCVELYRRFEDIRRLIPADQLLVLRFDEATGDLEGTLRKFFRFSGLEPDAETFQHLVTAHNGGNSKRHVNSSLSSFGIPDERVERDLGFVRRRYLQPSPKPAASSGLSAPATPGGPTTPPGPTASEGEPKPGASSEIAARREDGGGEL